MQLSLKQKPNVKLQPLKPKDWKSVNWAMGWMITQSGLILAKDKDFSLLHSVQTGSGAHQLCLRDVKFIIHFHLASLLGKCGTMPPLPHMCSCCDT
jgi:hypothetical protein